MSSSFHHRIAFFGIGLTLFCCVAGQSFKAEKSRRIGTEAQIIGRILGGDYDPFTRPPVSDFAQHSSVVVIVNAFINRVAWDGANAQVDLFLRQQWEDTRLSFDVDPRERGAVNEVPIPSNRQIWNPDTYFVIGEERPVSGKRQIIVEHSGYVRASEHFNLIGRFSSFPWKRGVATTAANLSARSHGNDQNRPMRLKPQVRKTRVKSVTVPVTLGSRFPFANTRTFTLQLGSYAYAIDDVIHVWSDNPPTLIPVEVADELKEGAFSFSHYEVIDCVGNYTIGQYSCIEVAVTFRGPMSETIFRVFIPSVFLIVVSWLHFWIHGSWSVPRTVSAALPFFLFAAVFVFYPQPYLAASGVGGIQVWFVFWCKGVELSKYLGVERKYARVYCSLGITFLSLLEYFFVICCGVRRSVHYYHGGSEAEHPLTAAREAAEEAYETRCASFKQKSGLDILSRVLFPVLFIIFVVLYLLWYLFL